MPPMEEHVFKIIEVATEKESKLKVLLKLFNDKKVWFNEQKCIFEDYGGLYCKTF